MNVQGAVAIVTGGASGLGLASARRLAGAGARLLIVDLATSPGPEVAAELGGEFAVADVADEASMGAAVAQAEAMGPVRVLVHCAGRGGA
ncbi:MAG TPA: SDR family NAD(P)-dependent oxidoreductase, partial [Roseococcus sp.]|nr:SDR family NAD(P)-dependent oxidoreductase [Roseococcus sp.]